MLKPEQLVRLAGNCCCRQCHGRLQVHMHLRQFSPIAHPKQACTRHATKPSALHGRCRVEWEVCSMSYKGQGIT